MGKWGHPLEGSCQEGKLSLYAINSTVQFHTSLLIGLWVGLRFENERLTVPPDRGAF
jgi:hypothetical protein